LQKTNLPDELNRCIDFHGHLCPGLAIGYAAARLGMRELNVERAIDEELLAIVENDTCAVDAVQTLTGCTFGKGNLFFHDYGKMGFTFANRADNSSVRLYFRTNPPAWVEDLPEKERGQGYIDFLLSHNPAELFDVKKDTLSSLPSPARIRESIPCEICGEKVIPTRLYNSDGIKVCSPCRKPLF